MVAPISHSQPLVTPVVMGPGWLTWLAPLAPWRPPRSKEDSKDSKDLERSREAKKTMETMKVPSLAAAAGSEGSHGPVVARLAQLKILGYPVVSQGSLGMPQKNVGFVAQNG